VDGPFIHFVQPRRPLLLPLAQLVRGPLKGKKQVESSSSSSSSSKDEDEDNDNNDDDDNESDDKSSTFSSDIDEKQSS
jgi:hypothetical protein